MMPTANPPPAASVIDVAGAGGTAITMAAFGRLTDVADNAATTASVTTDFRNAITAPQANNSPDNPANIARHVKRREMRLPCITKQNS